MTLRSPEKELKVLKDCSNKITTENLKSEKFAKKMDKLY